MSKPTREEPPQVAQRAPPPVAQRAEEHTTPVRVTRRALRGGAGCCTARVTVGVDEPAVAQSTISDMDGFVELSAALTGIRKEKLAPATGSIGIKQDYFN